MQAIQKNGYEDGNLTDGPQSSWLGYSLLPQGGCYSKSFRQVSQEDFLAGSPIEFPLLFTKDPGFNLTLYLGWAEAIGCERNDKLCGRIVLEPDDVHLHRGDDEEEDYDVWYNFITNFITNIIPSFNQSLSMVINEPVLSSIVHCFQLKGVCN